MIPKPVIGLLSYLHGLAADGVTASMPVAVIAGDLGVTERRAQQVIRQAQAAGLLDITNDQGGRGKWATYTLTPAGLETVKPAAPVKGETVKLAPALKGETVKQNGETLPLKGETVKPKRVKPAPMNDSYPESSRTLSLKRVPEDNRVESHSLPTVSPFPDGGVSPFSQRLPRLLSARGFQGKTVATLAQAAAAEDASENDILKAMIWAERQETRGRVDNWHGYLVACVKQDGWKACAAKADQRDPLTAPAAQSRVAAALRFFEEVDSVPASD